VIVAVAASIATFIYQANKPPVEVVDGMPPGLLALRAGGAPLGGQRQERDGQARRGGRRRRSPAEVVILDAVAIPDLEYTALVALRELGDEARARGIERWIAGLSDQDRRMFERYGLGPGVRIFATLDDAVAAYVTRTG
jgi:anti-anti-sigma regulatory factor